MLGLGLVLGLGVLTFGLVNLGEVRKLSLKGGLLLTADLHPCYVTDLTACTRCELYYCCLLSSRYTLALLRIMLFNLNVFNYMLLWLHPLALLCLSQCMVHVLATRNVFGAIS